MKRVGIFAGSFDPVHEGHLAFARQAIQECKLEKVFFLVEPRPRRKQGVRALEHRAKMVQLATKNEASMGSILLDHTRFTVAETLPMLKARFKGAELHLLFGDDVLKHLAGWPHIDELLSGVGFVVGIRSNSDVSIRATIKSLEKTRGIKVNYRIFNSLAPAISSTNIRIALKRGREANGVPGSVLEYILSNHLYGPHATA